MNPTQRSRNEYEKNTKTAHHHRVRSARRLLRACHLRKMPLHTHVCAQTAQRRAGHGNARTDAHAETEGSRTEGLQNTWPPPFALTAKSNTKRTLRCNFQMWEMSKYGVISKIPGIFSKKDRYFRDNVSAKKPGTENCNFQINSLRDLRCRSALCRALCLRYFAAPVLCFHAYFVLLGLLASPLSFRGSDSCRLQPNGVHCKNGPP
jgi:hypothetical protein